MKTKYMIVSYFPCSWDHITAPKTLSPKESTTLVHLVSNSVSEAEGCVWAVEEGKPPVAIFIFDDDYVDRLVDHLVHWSENRPEEWFSAVFKKIEPIGYGLALMPDLRKTEARHAIAHQIQLGYPVPEDREVTYLFKPISFFSRQLDTVRETEKFFGDKVRVAFAGKNAVQNGSANLGNSVEDLMRAVKAREIGEVPFSLENDGGMISQKITELYHSKTGPNLLS
jgi:hypothetical protein